MSCISSVAQIAKESLLGTSNVDIRRLDIIVAVPIVVKPAEVSQKPIECSTVDHVDLSG